jgi:uncharacterized protein (TIGR02246 family)
MTDEQQIRDLIEVWATAVHAGDLPAVLANHAPDIVMFDVPPPEQGVRGIDAYRDSWPGFFEWQSSGAVFEIESLDVTAGAEVAFAFALLRCGTPADFERDPEQRLRLTIGLSKVDDRWVVTHEHHSFADKTGKAQKQSVPRSTPAHHPVHRAQPPARGADLEPLVEGVGEGSGGAAARHAVADTPTPSLDNSWYRG